MRQFQLPVNFPSSRSLPLFLLLIQSVNGAPVSVLLSREDRKALRERRGNFQDSPVAPGLLFAALLCLIVILVFLIMRIFHGTLARRGLQWPACCMRTKGDAPCRRSSALQPRNAATIDVWHDTQSSSCRSPRKRTGIPAAQSVTLALINNSSPSAPAINVTESGSEELSSQQPTEPAPFQSPTPLTLGPSHTPHVDQIQNNLRRASRTSLTASLSGPTVQRSQQQPELNLSDDRSQANPGMINPRSSYRPEPIRLSLAPSSRLSTDMLSMTSGCSPSLAEFPLPPSGPLFPLIMSSPLDYVQADSRESGDPQPSTTLPNNYHDGADDVNTPASEIPNQNETLHYASPSTTSVRPPTYHDSWHHSPLSQSSFATLPLYPGEDGDRASVRSRVSYHNSAMALREVYRSLPPIPIPPLPPAKLSF